jgi:transcription elongation GreA/GreB family factor
MEGLSNQFIDPVKLSSGEIRTWCRELGVLQVQIRLVLSATEALTALFPRAAERTDLEDFLSWSDQLIERVARLVTPLQKRSPRGVNLDTAIAAHRAALERRRLKAAVQSHDGARWLIGPEFRGVDTDIDAILAAISVAEIVIQLQIPGEVRSRLLGGNSVAIARELLPTLKSLTTAFEDLEEFASVIAGYGAFDLHKWVGDDPHKGLLGFSQHLLTRARLSYENRQLINQWAGYLSRRREAMDLGLAQLIQLLENGIVPPPGLGRAYRYAVFSTIIRRIFLQYPLLGRFSGSKHSRVRSEFQRLDREIIRLRGGDVSARSLRSANPPLGRNGTRVDDKTEMILVNHLLPQQRPRMTVRKFLARAGRAVQALKPCFMMGPQAVAQYLSPDSIKFDLVIMDEASQLKPEEAIGAVARGSQLVVVGDPKQLPPTSFFTKMSQLADEEDQFSTTDAESILDVCLAQFRPPRMLRWHYRSQHHSLIAFSNHYFYRDLVIFPSPYGHSSKLGVRVVHLSDAIYENQTNIREAERVVSAVVDHIASRPDDSVGVVTLNLKQRDLIAELLEERLETVSAADAFRQRWASEAQPLFIKNLENVQGDERDAIIISTTFGRPAGADAVRQNFGPISRQGGWRRLNVLFTRARKSIALFTSLSPEDIVVDGTTPEGTKALRNYLEYARSGSLNATQETGREPDSDFEISVIELLKTNGYEVTPQLGVAGYRIDIAVEHPDFRGAYLAAIECDGATYHSAQSVRDRDRIRQEIIESMGWRDRVWRIWSTDWFRTPRQEAARLLEFLADLRKNWRPDYASGESWIEETRGTGSTLESDSARIRENLIEEDEDATAVRVTDTVKYVDIRKADNVMTVQITEATTDLAAGLVHRGTPLAKTFLGATVGDEVTMHLPGASPRTFRILEITNAERTA